MPPLRWAIISARLGLEGRRVSEVEGSGQEPTAWQMLTLEEVATKFSITRERVRQIELRFIKRLTDRTDEYFIVLSNTLMMIVSQAGGIISLSQAAEDLSEWINPGEAASEGFCRLILNNSPWFVSIKKNGIYALNSQPFRSYQSIIAAAREVVTKNSREWSITDLAEEVVRRVFLTMDNQETHGGLPSREFVAACLVATGGFEKGFSSPPEVALVRLLREPPTFYGACRSSKREGMACKAGFTEVRSQSFAVPSGFIRLRLRWNLRAFGMGHGGPTCGPRR